MRIYLVGAHSTGKTTLCRYISKNYHLTMVSEVARAVLAELEVPLESLRTDMDLVDNYQELIFERQMEAETKHKTNFVSDRAFDNLAYAAEHSLITSKIASSEVFAHYMSWIRSGTVLFLRPQKELLKEDGVRETPTWESALRIDGMVKLLLESYKINYLPINTPSMQERVRTIDFLFKSGAFGSYSPATLTT